MSQDVLQIFRQGSQDGLGHFLQPLQNLLLQQQPLSARFILKGRLPVTRRDQTGRGSWAVRNSPLCL